MSCIQYKLEVAVVAVVLMWGFPLKADDSYTQLKQQAAATCHGVLDHPITAQDIEDCYVDKLKTYRGRPEVLLKNDVRDAVAYCNHASDSSESQFCGDLYNQYRSLFDAERQEQILIARQEREKQQAEEDSQPQLTEVTAKAGVQFVPGAIVCADYDTVMSLVDSYQQHALEQMQSTQNQQQYRLLHGSGVTKGPNPALLGCKMLPSGTHMLLKRGNIVPVVIAKAPNGEIVKGVTLTEMIAQ